MKMLCSDNKSLAAAGILTFMSSSVTYPTLRVHHGRIWMVSTGWEGSKSRAGFRKKPNLRPDRVWFMRSMYWLRPMPSRRRPAGG